MSEQPGSDRPADQPPAGEPASPDSPPTAEQRDEPQAEETTAEHAPRWQGFASVPPPGPRRRRWLETAFDEEPADANRPPPPDERDDDEPPTPVDPWAGADLWGPHVPPHSPAPAYPPTRPYPVEPPAPHAAAPTAPPAEPPRATPPARPAAPPAAPPTRPQAPPAEPTRREKRRARKRARNDRPQPPPPGWGPPAGYIPVAVRRRRKWPWVLLLSLACCCGVPAYFAGPMAQQYPASAALPDTVADLSLREDQASKRTAQRLEREMQLTYWPEDTFAGVYSAASGKRVVIFGATGFRLSPDKDVNAEISRLRETYGLQDIRPIDTGVRGQHQRCGTGRWNGDSVVVCTWADYGSIASGVFDRLSVDDSARLLAEMRSSIVSRG